jgi:hypothetical protein
MNLQRFTPAIILACVLVMANDTPAQDKNPGHLRMALVNIKSLPSDSPDPAANRANIEINLKRHRDFIDRLSGDGAEFVGFPELSLNGYSFRKNDDLAATRRPRSQVTSIEG